MKIFKSPWLYVGIFTFLGFFTTIFNKLDYKIEYWALKPIPDSEIKDNDDFFYWVDWYLILWTIVLPTVLVYYLSKFVIKKVAGR